MIAKVARTPGLFSILAETLDMRSVASSATKMVSVEIEIDTTLCLRAGILSLDVDLVRTPVRPGSPLTSPSDFNRAAKSKSLTKFDADRLDKIVSSAKVDVTLLVPNSSAKIISSGQRVTASRLKFEPDSSERAVDRKIPGDQDRQAIAAGRDPATQSLGSLPLDSLAAVSSLSLSGRRATAVPIAKPRSAFVEENAAIRRVRVELSVEPGDAAGIASLRARARSKAGIIDEKTSTINFAQVGRLARQPMIPPDAVAAFTQLGKVIVTATQRDPLGTDVIIAVRSSKDYIRASEGFSERTYKFSCPYPETRSWTIDGIVETAVVRVFAAAGEVATSEFTSSVVKLPSLVARDEKTIAESSLVCTNLDAGIGFYIDTSGRSNVSSVMIRRVDTRNGAVYAVTNRPTTSAAARNTVDETCSDLVTYDYHLDIYTQSGDVLKSASVFKIRRIKPRKIIGVSISALARTIATGREVAISIESDIVKNDVDFLVDFMRDSGLDLPYQEDLTALKNSLLNCVKFDVYRTNLQTGETKFVGQTAKDIVDTVEDSLTRSRMLYFARAFIRSPSQAADIVGDRANNNIAINPDVSRLGLHITKADVSRSSSGLSTEVSKTRKFFSRENFETGTMPRRPAIDAFRDGETGDTAETVILFEPPSVTVGKVEVVTHTGVPTVSWVVAGSPLAVDRYIVEGISSGARWSVASAAHATQSTSCTVQDRTRLDPGRIMQYAVTPIYLDGSAGTTSTSSAYEVPRRIR